MNRIKAQSLSEIMLLLAIIAGVMIIMQKYVLRTLMGRTKMAAEQIGFGHQYQADNTLACLYVNSEGKWYPEDCAREHGGTAFSCPECADNCTNNKHGHLTVDYKKCNNINK
ncbi:MAG: hypothetical protein HQL26_10410 [Candidatus Omnitrophica bacterium]|nr:hypothetical protein [Candidatus Omnitrophota bacterium]